jgi:hypothetical protein
MVMTINTGVFLPDEQEQQEQSPKKSPQSANPDHGELSKLTEQELKSTIVAAWKKHEELAKAELAPLLYWLRERLRAQGARNDLGHDKDRGWEVWVTEHLDISRRTADRWCAWYADQAGLTTDGSTSGQVTGSDEPYEEILDQHRGKQQIAFNCWVPKAIHAQYQKALTTVQKKFGLKNTKEAVVQGVIYAAATIDKRAAGSRSQKALGHVSLSGSNLNGKSRRNAQSPARVRERVRAAETTRKDRTNLQASARSELQISQSRHGHRGEGSSKAMRAAAGR